MTGRFPGNRRLRSTSGDKRQDRRAPKDSPIVVPETQVLWFPIPDPLVELTMTLADLKETSGAKYGKFWMTAAEARALGARLIAEADKITLEQALERPRLNRHQLETNEEARQHKISGSRFTSGADD